MEAACITTVTCGAITAFTSVRILTTVRDRLYTAVRFTRDRRRTGISGRGIVLRHLDFGHRYIDPRRVGADPLAVAADTGHHQMGPGLLVVAAAADTNRRQTMAVNLPAVAEANHPLEITEADGLRAMGQAQNRPAMAVPLDQPHNRRRVLPVLHRAILTLVSRRAANRPSGRLLNRIREPVQAALTAASAENPSVRRAIAARQAPGAPIAQGESNDETA